VTSSLKPAWIFFWRTPPNEDVASSFAVFILQDLQKSTCRLPTKFIFVLQLGQSIAILFFVKPSRDDLHLMFGQTYLCICFFVVGVAHFGQVCSETSSPCSIRDSLDDNFRISSFIGFLIFLKRYWAIARGQSGNWSFVWKP